MTWPVPLRSRATPATIKRAEDALSCEFPEDYRQFLANSDGGKPERAAFEVRGIWTALTMLHSAEEGDAYSLASVAEMVSMWPIPEVCRVIGEDPGGNMLLLVVDGLDKGAVGFLAACGWPVGEEPEPIPLAPSFDAFMQSCRAESLIPTKDWVLPYGQAAASEGHGDWGVHPPRDYHWHFEAPSKLQLVDRDMHWMAPHVSSTRPG